MKPRRNPDVKSTLLPDGYVVLVSSQTDWAHTLTPAGALVWELCDGRHSTDEIAGEIAGMLPAPVRAPDKAEIDTLVSELLDLGLLQS